MLGIAQRSDFPMLQPGEAARLAFNLSEAMEAEELARATTQDRCETQTLGDCSGWGRAGVNIYF